MLRLNFFERWWHDQILKVVKRTRKKFWKLEAGQFVENLDTVKFGKLLVERRVSLEGRIKLEFLVLVSKNSCSVCYSSEARDFLCNNIKHPKFIQRIEGFFVKKVALLNLSGLLIPRFPIFFAKFLKPRKYSDTRKTSMASHRQILSRLPEKSTKTLVLMNLGLFISYNLLSATNNIYTFFNSMQFVESLR